MEKLHHFLAFDLGATSGRSILATVGGDKLEMKELTRFPNVLLPLDGKFYWNIYGLYEALRAGLFAAAKEGVKIDSIGIDTWGVDFVYVGKDGSFLGCPRAYRDPYTEGAPEKFFQIVPRKEVYDATGIQIMNFNSLYQLFTAKNEGSSALEAADKILFMPDALSYMLTGKQVCEYTIASTSQMLNPKTKQFEQKLLDAAGVKSSLLPDIIVPGTVIGTLTDALAEETGLGKVPVVAVAGHDTASAVAAVPAEGEGFAYLSSGTWSLMGIEVKDPIITEDSFSMNFTNEGGVEGTARFLKNITGMWLLEQCRKEWKKKQNVSYSYPV
ncbi:MAG: rhamnulokinase, partial [Bacteroidales bacterium]|nr:rhamnulokinase [Bacteroidales bacterium]